MSTETGLPGNREAASLDEDAAEDKTRIFHREIPDSDAASSRRAEDYSLNSRRMSPEDPSSR